VLGLNKSINSLDQLEKELRQRLPCNGQSRHVLALVGAPASGKSTLADELARRLADCKAVVVPMDGFHLDNVLLDEDGLRAIKGSPQTFDVAGLDSLLERLVQNTDTVLAPLFDRSADLARAAATRIDTSRQIIIVEGNYLLLDRPGWNRLARHFDLSVVIDVDEDELRSRLVERWLHHGLNQQDALERAESNDLPNGRVVIRESLAADLHYSSDSVIV